MKKIGMYGEAIVVCGCHVRVNWKERALTKIDHLQRETFRQQEVPQSEVVYQYVPLVDVDRGLDH